mgnify:CR=1 FL=1
MAVMVSRIILHRIYRKVWQQVSGSFLHLINEAPAVLCYNK